MQLANLMSDPLNVTAIVDYVVGKLQSPGSINLGCKDTLDRSPRRAIAL